MCESISSYPRGQPCSPHRCAMSACGTRAGDARNRRGQRGKVAKIGVIAPLSGDLSALGLGIQNSVDLAIKQANESNTIPGWTLELAAQDDEAKPDVGKNAATKLAGDDDVVGVVGTLNSSVVAVGAAGALRGEHRPGLAGQHQPDPDPGPGPGQPDPGLPELLPDLHHGRRPGPVRGQVPARRRASRRSPPSTTRRPTARAWSPRSPRRSSPAAATSSRPRRSTPTTRTSPRSSARSRAPTPRPSTTAVSTRRPVR